MFIQEPVFFLKPDCYLAGTRSASKRNLKDQNVLISEGELVERDLQTRTRLQSVVLIHVLHLELRIGIVEMWQNLKEVCCLILQLFTRKDTKYWLACSHWGLNYASRSEHLRYSVILTPAGTKSKAAGAAWSWPVAFKEPHLIRGAVQPLPYISFAFELYAVPLQVKVNHPTWVSARYCLILDTIFLFPFSNFLELEASTMKNEYSFGSVVASDWNTKTSIT